jgi:transcriptional regulator with XRE-family HTH domain
LSQELQPNEVKTELYTQISVVAEKLMNFAQALDQTLEEFGISGKWLSERSGVSQQMISGFRKGNQRVYSDSLEKIIATLPSDARQHFFGLLGNRGTEQTSSSLVDLTSVVERLDKRQLAGLLCAIADRIENQNSALAKELLSA